MMARFQILFILLFGFAITGSAVADNADKSDDIRTPLPIIKITKPGECVDDTDEMRRNHMNKILHQRDITMYDGIRTKQYSLKNCVDCHADENTNSVLGKEGFCESCHTYAAVQIDCFSCHSDKREVKTSVSNKDDNKGNRDQ